jgi:lipoprotein-anchoring transpeptidase ErfK/SrfK
MNRFRHLFPRRDSSSGSGSSRRRFSRRTVAVSATVAAAVLAAGGFLAAQFAGGPPQTGDHPSTASHVSSGLTLIATAKGTIPRYASPGSRQDGTVPASWYGASSALPVVGQRPGWYEVRLATRPNGSTAWVRAANVTITSTQYQVVVSLASKHLELLRAGKVILDTPAAIGTAQDPTPTGRFFLAFFEKPISAGYGPFIIVTSAHSNAIGNWEKSGDALIGIHGPLGSDDAIGTSGARLSHGCIRLHVPDLVRLRDLPAGTPLTITA